MLNSLGKSRESRHWDGEDRGNAESQETRDGLTRTSALFDLHLLGVIIYTFRRSSPVESFSPGRTRPGLGQSLHGLDTQLLASAGTQSIDNQEYQIRMVNLLHAERSETTNNQSNANVE